MKRDPIKDGTHTWDLYLEYHKCDQCGYIIEDRQLYQEKSGEWVKLLHCNRCGNEVIVTKNGD